MKNEELYSRQVVEVYNQALKDVIDYLDNHEEPRWFLKEKFISDFNLPQGPPGVTP